MKRVNQLLAKTILYAIGTAAAKLISAIVIPIYAFFVSATALGDYDYVLTLAGIAAPIFYLAIWESILRFALIAEGETRIRIVNAVAKFSFAVTFILALATGTLVFFFPDHRELIGACGLMAMSNSLAQIWQFFARSEQRTKLYVSSGIASSLVNLALLLILVCAVKLQFLGLVISYVLAQLAIFLILELKLRIAGRALKCPMDYSLLKEALKFSVPLVFNLAISLLLAGFGRLLIVNELGAYENGLYAFAMKFGNILAALGAAFSMAAIEEAILRIGSDGLSKYFSSVIDGLWRLLLSACIVLVPLIRIFYFFIDESSYGASFSMVPLFLMYAVFGVMSTNYGNAFQITLNTRYAAFTTLLGLVVAVVLSLLLIGKMGVDGVALSLTLGMGAVLASRWIASKGMIEYGTSKRPILYMACFIAVSSILVIYQGESQVLLTVGMAVACSVFALPAWRGIKLLRSIENVREAEC